MQNCFTMSHEDFIVLIFVLLSPSSPPPYTLSHNYCFYLFVVVTGASEGIGRGYALEVTKRVAYVNVEISQLLLWS